MNIEVTQIRDALLFLRSTLSSISKRTPQHLLHTYILG